ncbi:phosphatidate phosphatase LPIN3-like [Haliotis cracherodii]|uniref:phosphatidate phosphatase LPIN3-like n=1 Tax=Haliotis cracherodii TaxID=6455 RepID=UPI0039EB243E
MSLGFVGRLFSGIKGYYNEINGATLTGAIDVLIVEQEDGTYLSSPFHVRFGKMGVLRSREKVVDIEINGEVVDLHMKLGEAGEAFFVQQVCEPSEEFPEYLATSPIPSSMALMMGGVEGLKLQAQQSDEAKVTEWQQRSLHGAIPENTEDEASLIHTISLKDLKSDSSHDELLSSSKQRRKVYTKKKQKSGKCSPRTHLTGSDQEGVFEMDTSESSDEELKKLSVMSKSLSMPLPQSAEDKPHIKSWRKSSTIEAFMHPLSEPEMDPMDAGSPLPSRCPSPKSDTEVDLQRVEDSQRSLLMEDSGTWEWGAFPTPPSSEMKVPEIDHQVKEDEGSKQQAGGLFKLWKKTPDKDIKRETKEIYLDELTLEDPEMAKIYLGTPKGFQSIKEKEDDTESGRGPSLPQSPHSVEGAIGGPSVSFLQSEVRHLGRVSLSLCGGLGDPDGVNLDKFMQKVVTFDDLSDSPNMITNPDLVVKVDDGYFNWATASPMILSQIVFRQDLPESTSQSLIKEHMPKKEKKKGYSWFSWRRGDNAVPPSSASSASELNIDTSSNKSNLSDVGSPPTSPPPSVTSTPRKVKKDSNTEGLEEHHTSSEADTDQSEKDSIGSPKTSMVEPSSAKTSIVEISSTKTSIVEAGSPKTSIVEAGSPKTSIVEAGSPKSLSPGSPRSGSVSPSSRASSVKSDHSGHSVKSDSAFSLSAKSDVVVSVSAKIEEQAAKNETKSDDEESLKPDKFKKTLRLSSEQIAKLKLKEGQNEISFSVTTQYQGTTRCTSHIYLWKYSDHIVVSDIDGTITKSDVLGQILPIIGRDWSQSGVASLFTRIHKNGYKFLYLSARAIGQSRITKDLLRGIKQGELVLPEGPLLLNPTSLISAFHREVITKKPEEFKISCLKDINALFTRSPFYAGFGNKINDVWAYRALNIPNFRIFTINHRGELRHELSNTFQSSYTRLSDVVDYFFPPVEKKTQACLEEFSSVSFWREPLPSIDLELIDETKVGKGDGRKVEAKKEIKR